ncbi:MAG: hypothetical protein NC548_40990 [Lachnospiraceae bacterium]|nr:hypothetical protein [Lachnospiraceae bacterium]
MDAGVESVPLVGGVEFAESYLGSAVGLIQSDLEGVFTLDGARFPEHGVLELQGEDSVAGLAGGLVADIGLAYAFHDGGHTDGEGVAHEMYASFAEVKLTD